jgi:hypothetical protein
VEERNLEQLEEEKRREKRNHETGRGKNHQKESERKMRRKEKSVGGRMLSFLSDAFFSGVKKGMMLSEMKM